MNEVRQAIRQLAGTHDKDIVKIYVGDVVSVDEDARTCEVLVLTSNAEYTLPNCLLCASDADGFVQIPNVDSQVVVAETVRSGRYVIKTSDLQKVIFIQDEFIINEGKNGGVPISQNITDRLNQLEQKLNTFIGIYNAHTHISPPAPVNPVTTAPTVSIMTQTATITQSSQLENTKFKH